MPRSGLHQEQEKAVRRLYVNDSMPHEYRHLRDSESKVKDKVAKGLTVNEASNSVVLEVGQGLFVRKEWKKFGDNSDTFDLCLWLQMRSLSRKEVELP